jgi:putative membrane protein
MHKHFIITMIITLCLAVGCGQQRGSERAGNEGQGGQAGTTATGTTQGDQQTGTGTGKSIGSADQQFVQQAASSGMAEVELSNMVAGKSQNEAVKQLAQRIAQDHQQGNQQLQSAVQQANGTMPTDLDESAQDMRDRMSKMSGAALDKAYINHIIEHHQKDIQLYEQEANNGTESGIKSFAQSTLPTLREHLQMAKQTQAKLGSS